VNDKKQELVDKLVKARRGLTVAETKKSELNGVIKSFKKEIEAVIDLLEEK